MMNSQESSTNLEQLNLTEVGLMQKLMQRATLEYRAARRLDEAEGGHLQGVAIETPEPTVAFRMDSKQQYLGPSQTIDRQELYIYVPAEADPERWLTRLWVKHVQQDGVEAMYEVNEHGARPYIRKAELQAVGLEAQKSGEAELELDIDVDQIVLRAVKQKQQSIVGLQRLAESLRSDFMHVPFYS